MGFKLCDIKRNIYWKEPMDDGFARQEAFFEHEGRGNV